MECVGLVNQRRRNRYSRGDDRHRAHGCDNGRASALLHRGNQNAHFREFWMWLAGFIVRSLATQSVDRTPCWLLSLCRSLIAGEGTCRFHHYLRSHRSLLSCSSRMAHATDKSERAVGRTARVGGCRDLVWTDAGASWLGIYCQVHYPASLREVCFEQVPSSGAFLFLFAGA